jgi:hypothetical protein
MTFVVDNVLLTFCLCQENANKNCPTIRDVLSNLHAAGRYDFIFVLFFKLSCANILLLTHSFGRERIVTKIISCQPVEITLRAIGVLKLSCFITTLSLLIYLQSGRTQCVDSLITSKDYCCLNVLAFTLLYVVRGILSF